MTRTIIRLQTNQGPMDFELYDELVPKTVENFKKLISEGFYDGVRFNKISRGRTLETGDPLSKDILLKLKWGTGGPGYTLDREECAELTHDKSGLLSMAVDGEKIAGSRFIITSAPLPALDGKNVVFGHITSGEEVIEGLRDVGTDYAGRVSFIGYIVIEKATIM